MAELTRADYVRLHEFRYAIRRFLQFSEGAARAVGLDPQQHQLLLTIQACGPDGGVTVSHIAERLRLRHHTAVELVDRAVARGFVMRRRQKEDHRFVLVSITDTGRQLIKELSAAHLVELSTAGPELVRLLLDIVGSQESARPAD
jgi:DNA-binding MarR family transcriptional regulator